MKSRRGKKIAFIFGAILLLICFFLISALSDKALSYDTTVAHPNIARLAAELYNQQSGVVKLSNHDIDLIAKGSEEEDTPFRWYNHFYDPIYNRGIWFGKQYSTAKDWAKTSKLQNYYALGDQSWDRALYSYSEGDRDAALVALGHVIHLLSDMTVPAHTRDDIHPSGDSYEQFVKTNWNSIYSLIKDKIKFKEVLNIDSAFDVMASFSNGYFYSDDTIEDGKYNKIMVKENILSINGEKFRFYNANFGPNEYYLFFNPRPYSWQNTLNNEDSSFSLNNKFILNGYSTQLIPKAIGYSSGLIQLFFSEAAKGNKGKDVAFFQTTPLGYGNTFLGAIGNGVQSLWSNLKNGAVAPARSEDVANLSTGQNMAELSQNVVNNPVVSTPVIVPVQATKPTPATNPPPTVIVPKTQLPIIQPNTELPPVTPVVVPNLIPTYHYSGGSASQNSPVNNSTNQVVSVDPTTTSSVENIPIIPTTTTDIPTTTPETPSTTTNIPTTTIEVPSSTIPTTTTVEIPTTTPEAPTTTIEIPTTTPETPTTTIITPTTTPEAPTSTPATSTLPTYPLYSQEVVINEIAWAGTSADYPTHEWIELYNPTDQDIKIFSTSAADSWKLKFGDRYIDWSKIENSTISAHGYYLMERTQDNVVREVPADYIFSLAYGINNSGVKVQLIKPDGTISDEVDASEGWFAGDTIKYRTMERLNPNASGSDPANWQSNQGPRLSPRTFNGGQVYGSPKSSNTGGMVALNTTQEDGEVVVGKANNPYVLGCYVVPAGKKLTIEAGAIVKSYAGYSCLDVYGTLQINGTLAEPVVFTSGRDLVKDQNFVGQYSSGEPLTKDWQGIRFYPGSIGNISSLDMRYAGKEFYPNGYVYTVAVSEAIRAEGASLNIQNSRFLHNGAKFIHALASTNLTVENSVFTDGGMAIQADGGTAVLNNNEFLTFTEDPSVQVIILP